jgi:chromosome segregation ATPase
MSIETTLIGLAADRIKEWEAAFNEAVDGALEWKKTAEALGEQVGNKDQEIANLNRLVSVREKTINQLRESLKEKTRRLADCHAYEESAEVEMRGLREEIKELEERLQESELTSKYRAECVRDEWATVDGLKAELETETERADANYDDFIQLDQEYGELVEQYQAKGKALDRQIAINEAHLRWIEGCTNWLGEHTGWWLKLLAHHGWDKPGTSTTYREIKLIHDAYHEVGDKYPWEEGE